MRISASLPRWPGHAIVAGYLVYALAFWVLEQIARSFTITAGISLWYPGVGLTIVFAFLAGVWALPGMLVSVIISGLSTFPELDRGFIGLTGTLHVLAYGSAGLLLRRFQLRTTLDRLRDLIWLICLLFGSVAIVALAAAAALATWGTIGWESYANTAMGWWLGDTAGGVVTTTFLLVNATPLINRALFGRPLVSEPIHGLEVLAQCLALLGSIWVIFYSPLSAMRPLFYFFPPVIWISLRSGMRGATAAIWALSLGTSIGIQQHTYSAIDLIQLQQLMLVLALAGMILAVLVEAQRRTTGELRRSEELNRAIIHDQLELVCRYTPDTQLLFVNDAYCRFFGRRAEDLNGISFLTVVSPDQHQHMRETIARTIAADGPVEDLAQVKRADGERRWIQWVNRAVRSDDGQVQIQVVGRDVTEQRRAEEAYRSLVDQSIQGLAIIQGQHLVFVNPALSSILGYSQADLMQLDSLLPVIAPEDQPGLIRELLSLDQSQWGGRTIELRIVRRTGGIRWVSIAIVSTLYVGEPAVMAMIIDITERKQAEAALQMSEERYRIVSELISDYTYAYYLQPDGRMKREWLAGAFSKITGYTEDEVEELGGFEAIVHPDDLPSMLERRHLMYAGTPYLNEMRIVRKDGQIRTLNVWIRPQLNAEGRLERIYGAARDISDRKEAEAARAAAERQLQEAQKLESLGLLAGGIAHDFNNLLVAVLGHAEIAELEVPPGSAAAENMRQIIVAAGHGADLTRQLLAYAGKGQVAIRALEVNSLISEALELLRLGVPRTIALRQQLAPSLPRIEGDVIQLRQVLMNIVLNSAEAIGKQSGSITIATGLADPALIRSATFSAEPSAGRYVAIHVSDTGRGMDEVTRARIFEPFFTTKASGRGLGLAAVLGIVRSHYGAIKIESAIGVGTSFTVLLPAIADQAPATPH